MNQPHISKYIPKTCENFGYQVYATLCLVERISNVSQLQVYAESIYPFLMHREGGGKSGGEFEAAKIRGIGDCYMGGRQLPFFIDRE